MSDPEKTREPIVDAVLADPVVKAVLSDPAAAPMVVDALHSNPAIAADTSIPTPVQVATAAAPVMQPGQVGVMSPSKPDVLITSEGKAVAAPTTTEEEDRVAAGQRDVNLIWETTQMRVALSVIWMALLVSGSLAVFGRYIGSPELQLAAVVFLFGVANLVTGFYFGRTNHQKTGGVGQVIGR